MNSSRKIAGLLLLLSLSACGADGDDKGQSAKEPSPTVSISLSQASVALNQKSLLTWSSTGATACVASDGWTGSQAVSGNISVSSLTAGRITYTLTCTNSGGSTSVQAALDVTALPASIIVPAGFSVDSNLVSLKGPISMDNFAHAYLNGGVVPANGAEVTIVTADAPPPPLSNYIDVEMHDPLVSASAQSNVTLGGISCSRVEASETQGSTPLQDVATYCVSSGKMIKIYLTFHKGDTKEAAYRASLGEATNALSF